MALNRADMAAEQGILPAEIREQILEFLELGLSLHEPEQRKLLLIVAELGEELEASVSLSGSVTEFCRELLECMLAAGRISDGRWALDALLKAAVRQAPVWDQNYGESVLASLSAWRKAPATYRRLGSGNVVEAAREDRRPGTQTDLVRFVLDPALDRLRMTIREVTQDHRPHICLIYGAEGTGKTEILKALARMEFGRKTWWYWFRSQSPPRFTGLRLAQSSGVALPLILQLYKSFGETFGSKAQQRDLKLFKERLEVFNHGLREHVENRLSGQPELKSKVGQDLLRVLDLGGLVALSLMGQQFLPYFSIDYQLLADLASTTAEAARDMVGLLRRCLEPTELNLLQKPRSELVSLLAQGLTSQVKRHGMLWVAMDEYEGYSSFCRLDLEELIHLCGPGFLWVLTARSDVFMQPDFMGLKTRLDAHFHSIQLQLLSERDILQVLREIHRSGPIWHHEPLAALDRDARRIHTLTRGRFPDIAAALSIWKRHGNLESELLSGQVNRLEQPVHSASRRFLFAYLCLTPWEGPNDREEILSQLFARDNLEEMVHRLAACCPAVHESEADLITLDPTFEALVRSHLKRAVVRVRSEIRNVHQVACSYLQDKRRSIEGAITPPRLFTNSRWREVTLALSFHLFHLDADAAWHESPRLILACWTDRSDIFRCRTVEMLRSLSPMLGTGHQDRLERFAEELRPDDETARPYALRREIELLVQEGLAANRLPNWEWRKLIRSVSAKKISGDATRPRDLGRRPCKGSPRDSDVEPTDPKALTGSPPPGTRSGADGPERSEEKDEKI